MLEAVTLTRLVLSCPIAVALSCATPLLAQARAPDPEKETSDAVPKAEGGEPADEDATEDADTKPEDDEAAEDADEEPAEDDDSADAEDDMPADEEEDAARAEDTKPPVKTPTATRTRSRARKHRSDEPVTGPMLTREHVVAMNRRARGVGLGYDNGLWGRGFAQGIKIDVPFGKRVGQFFGLRVRTAFVHSLDGPYDPVINTGLEAFGRGPVIYGVVRAYGGGGAWIGIRPVPTSDGGTWAITGGGHFGFEVFYTPRSSFTFEVGGQGSGHHLDMDAGASVLAGIVLYLGDIRRKR